MDSATASRKRHLLLGAAFGVGGLGLLITGLSSGPEPDESFRDLTSRHDSPPMPDERDESLFRNPVDDALAVMRPAPIGETQPRERANVLPTRPAVELRVFCTPTTFRWIGRPLEITFEDQERGVDVVLEQHSDRDCVGHLLMGSADVVLITDELSPSEQSRNLTERVIAHRIVVPIVHTSNSVDSLHDADLDSILNGKLHSWRGAGGDEKDLLPVCERVVRRTDEASRSLRVHQGAENLAVFLDTPTEILAFVSNDPRAVGLIDLVHARNVRSVRMLKVNHVEPSREAMVRGAWPLGATVRAVSQADADALARTFLAFLESEVARRVLARQFTLPN